MNGSDGTGRRKVLAVVGGGIACALVGLPAAVFVAAPVKGGSAGPARWVRTVKLESLHAGEPKKVSIVADRRDAWTLERNVELGAVWLVRRGDGASTRVDAYSVTCPHLGCSVDKTSSGFFCPCHDSSFDPEGKRLTGPSPRDLDRLETRVEDGYVVVDYRVFRQGTPERIEIA